MLPAAGAVEYKSKKQGRSKAAILYKWKNLLPFHHFGTAVEDRKTSSPSSQDFSHPIVHKTTGLRDAKQLLESLIADLS